MYTTPSGAVPVADFIDSLDEKAQAKIIHTMNLLKEFGIDVSVPHTEKLTDTDIWELRILGGDSLRVFYVAVQDRTFLLLHGFKKKSQKTSLKELRVAKDRLREYRSRGQTFGDKQRAM